MKRTIIVISSLLFSIGILLFGNGLQGTLLTLRGAIEGFSESTIGIIMSMYFIGFVFGSFLCPKVIQRVGHIRTFSIMASTSASTIILMGFFVNPQFWSIMRFVLGICMVGIYLVIESWLNTQANNKNRGRVFGIYILVNLLFLASGQFLILIGDINSLDLFAITAALFSISLIPVALTRLSEPPPVNEIRIQLRKLYQISSLGFMGSFISGLLSSSFWAMGPLFARLSDLNEFGIALFMSATIFGGALLQWPIGYWSDTTDRRMTIVLVCIISAIVSLLAILLTESLYWLMVCMFLFGGMLFSIYPISVAHVNDHPDATDRVTISINLLLVYGIGAAIGPAIGGLLMDLFGRYSLFGLFITGSVFLAGYAYYLKQHGTEITDTDKTNFVPLVRTSQVVASNIIEEKDTNITS